MGRRPVCAGAQGSGPAVPSPQALARSRTAATGRTTPHQFAGAVYREATYEKTLAKYMAMQLNIHIRGGDQPP